MTNYADPALHAHGLWIGGQWRAGGGIPVINPSTGLALAEVADAPTDDRAAEEAAEAEAAAERAAVKAAAAKKAGHSGIVRFKPAMKMAHTPH